MITSYKQLTKKYLMANKKRTLLTIIGIILSVALISSIGLFFKGVQDAQVQEFKDVYGSYHLAFSKPDERLITKISNNPKVSRKGLFAFGGEVKLGDKIVAMEVLATGDAPELLPCRIKEGKMPENRNETAVERWALNYIDKAAKPGDKIKIAGKEYVLSGILEDNMHNQIENRVLLLSKVSEISKEKSTLLVEISTRTNIGKAVGELKQLGEKDRVSENSYLLVALGVKNENYQLEGLYATLAVIIGIVVISTIAVIYNSFQISVVEKIKQFGLLRAVGTTPKQIRRIVLREATVLAALGIPIGLLCGIIAIYGISIVFKLTGGDSVKLLKVSVSPAILAMGALLGLASVYISALLPALFAGRISPLVAISSRASITKEKMKKRKSTISGKLFGFEGSMASKNMKRNRKRYRITVFSIVISVVLFIAFKSFMDMTLNISNELNESKNIHFSVIRNKQVVKEEKAIDDKMAENIRSLESIDTVYKMYDACKLYSVINKSSEVRDIREMGNIYKNIEFEGIERTLIKGSITVYDEISLEVSKKYLSSGRINIEQMNRENGVVVIGKNRISDVKTDRSYFGAIAEIKVGDEIYIQYRDKPGVEFGKGKIKKVKVVAVVKYDPFIYRGDQDGLKLVTTENVGKRLIEGAFINPDSLNITVKDIKKVEKAQIDIEDMLKSDPSLKLVNEIDDNKNRKSTTLMIQILVYGFVVVISLIGSVNIINTVTTNIILRRRELAALKSIGLTQKGLKKMIVLEGLFYGAAGTIYGSVFGCGLSYVMFRGLSSVREFSWRIPWNAIAIAAACALAVGYISVLSPLSRIKKENLIEMIREEY